MKLRYFLILAALVGWFAHDGQAQDVTQSATFTGAASAPIVVAKAGSPGGSSTWALTWYVTGFTAATVHLQGSQDCSTFSDITTAALILEGSNPTSWTSSTASNRMVVRSYLPCVQVTVDTLTGSGSLVTLLLGYKGSNATPLSASSGGGGSSTVLLSCNAHAEVSLSGTGYTQIIAASGSTVIKICKLFVTSSSTGNPTVNTFTAAFGSCSGSPTEFLNGAGITGIDSDFGGAMQSAAGGALCVKESVAQSDKVTVTYIQM